MFDGCRHRRKQTSTPTLHVSNTLPNLLAIKSLPLCLLSLGFKPVILGLSDGLLCISTCPLELHMVYSVLYRKPLGVHFVLVLNHRFNGISTLPEAVRVMSFLNSHEAVADSISADFITDHFSKTFPLDSHASMVFSAARFWNTSCRVGSLSSPSRAPLLFFTNLDTLNFLCLVEDFL